MSQFTSARSYPYSSSWLGNFNEVIPWPSTPWENTSISEQKPWFFFFHFEVSYYVKIFSFPSRSREKIMLSEHFCPSWVFWVNSNTQKEYCQLAVFSSMRNNTSHGEGPCITPSGMSQQCSLSGARSDGAREPHSARVWAPSPAASAMLSLPVQQRKQAHNSSSLSPASSPSRGITCLPTPLCWVTFL